MASGRVSKVKGKVVDIPNPPTIGTATAGGESVSIAFTAYSGGKGGPTRSYIAKSNPGNITATGSTSPINVTGLTAGTSYTVSVAGVNETGTGEYSSASDSAVPTVATSYESIATITVSGTSTDTISFTSIPSTYKHLQLRITQQTSAYDVWNYIGFNNDTTYTNYWTHRIFGTGGGGTAEIQANNNQYVYYEAVSGHSTTSMAGQIIDILDYTNTNKNKVVRHLSGHDNNGSGFLWFGSVVWNSTSAINRLDYSIAGSGKTYTADSTFALYGVKG